MPPLLDVSDILVFEYTAGPAMRSSFFRLDAATIWFDPPLGTQSDWAAPLNERQIAYAAADIVQ